MMLMFQYIPYTGTFSYVVVPISGPFEGSIARHFRTHKHLHMSPTHVTLAPLPHPSSH